MMEPANIPSRVRMVLDEEVEEIRNLCVNFSGPRYKLQQWVEDSDGNGVWVDLNDKAAVPVEITVV